MAPTTAIPAAKRRQLKLSASLRLKTQPKFYFPELDGLRFVAFLLVFIHHAPVPDYRIWRFINSFGWIGVDLFFALSAFLIVKLLAKEHSQTGTISIWRFYVRRGLRIWPIYFLFCALMLPFSDTWRKSWRALGLFTFTDNLMSVGDWYNRIAYSRHLWTISYEEQFYLFIPLLLLFLLKASRSRVVVALSGIAVLFTLCRAVMIWLEVRHPAIWVLPVTHFESILLGIVIGLGGFGVLSKVPTLLILMVGLLCGWLLTGLGPVHAIDWNLMILYPLIGLSTSLILYFVFLTGRTRSMKWLSFGPLVFLGKISYGLYVYHLLGLALGEKVFHHPDLIRGRVLLYSKPLTIFLVSLGITVTIAAVSYLLIEKPFLKLKKRYEVIASRPA